MLMAIHQFSLFAIIITPLLVDMKWFYLSEATSRSIFAETNRVYAHSLTLFSWPLSSMTYTYRLNMPVNKRLLLFDQLISGHSHYRLPACMTFTWYFFLISHNFLLNTSSEKTAIGAGRSDAPLLSSGVSLHWYGFIGDITIYGPHLFRWGQLVDADGRDKASLLSVNICCYWMLAGDQ